ncbi:MAG: hypothetical protein VB095_00375 [Anaerovorax sp.]|nr:hypothetical protein [Anaerovorax sp.]
MTIKNDFDESILSKNQDEQLNEIIDLLHDLPPIPVPDEFNSRLKHALQIEKKRKKITVLKRWSAVAAVFFVGFISVLFLKDGNLVMPANLSLKDYNKETDQVLEEVDEKYGTVHDENLEELEEDETKREKTLGTITNEEIEENDQVQITQKDRNNMSEMPKKSIVQEETHSSDSSLQTLSAKPSRSIAYSGTAEEFNRCSEEKILEIVEMINQQNSFAVLNDDTYIDINMEESSSSEEITNEISQIVKKLYQDIFNNQQVTYKNISKHSVAGKSQVYEVQGNGKTISITITNSPEGIHISEPILDHGEWLEEQLSNTTYVLENYETIEEDSIVFHVNVLVNENGENVNEVRSIVWKPTKL